MIPRIDLNSVEWGHIQGDADPIKEHSSELFKPRNLVYVKYLLLQLIGRFKQTLG